MAYLPLSRTLRTSLLLSAALAAPFLAAQAGPDDAYPGEDPARHAMVRVLEGEATVRKGETEEPLGRGVPIGVGDEVDSRGRGILQLADGSRIAFAPGTHFQVAALFPDGRDDGRVLLRLDTGRLRVVQGRDSAALLRVDTAAGTGSLSGNASATFEVAPDRTVRIRVEVGRISFANEREQVSLVAGERLTAFGSGDRLDRIRNVNTFGGDAFDDWCDRHLSVPRGPSWERVPAELRYYSSDLDEHGEWIYLDEYRTWCWRPLGLATDWRPYWYGRWAPYPGGMTWISDEPWGYVTYHHGRWGWGAGLGWYWIPGAYYAPAWVVWRTADVYFGWAPMGFAGAPVVWGYGPWRGGACWNVVEISRIHAPHIHAWTHSDPFVTRRFDPWPTGNRTLSPPWHQSPVVVTPGEFRDAARFQRITQDPALSRSRLQAYDARTGAPAGRPLASPWTAPRTPAAPAPVQGGRPGPAAGPATPPWQPGGGQPHSAPSSAGPRPPSPATPQQRWPQERPQAAPGPVPPPPIPRKRPLGRP